jgi:hypothetical protein
MEVPMLNIGDSPINFTLTQFDTGDDVSLSSYCGKTVLVSFIEIDSGWDWLVSLVNIQSVLTAAGIASNIQIIAVIFKYMGCTNCETVLDKVSSDPDLPTPGEWPFPVLVDCAWVNSSSKQYQNGFANTVDLLYHGGAGSALWSYQISSDYKITDKWHPNITSVGDPISFNKLTSVGTFNSADWSATEAFVEARIANLCATPKILYANPVSGSNLSSVNIVKFICSKLLSSGAATAGNYSLGGTVTGLSLSGASFTGADRVENVVTLSLSGTPSSGSLSVAVGSGVTDTAGNAFQTGGSSVSYIIP